MTKEPLEPSKAVGDCFKLSLRSTDAVALPDNSFRFNVDMSVIKGEDVRCAVRKITYPPPATYIARRLFFADGNTWKTSHTNASNRGQNDYDNLLAKYGLNNWIYVYYPTKNMFFRFYWNATENTQIRQTWFSTSADGINWTTQSGMTAIGLLLNFEWSGGGSLPINLYEIDTTTTPVGTNIQNIHIQELSARRSWDTSKNDLTDIIGNIPRTIPANPYTFNDFTLEVKDYDCCNEISADQLKNTRTLNVYFTEVNAPNVKESVVLPWSMEVMFFID